ncbi:uncharacterized protein V1516DRAFT_661877 [Lipomyces oligophaga]|uniref:uncharacterized protein n=1 Tax=Lipomyces oligophaga TaxID=45792 RepID=UPI0034CEF809
MDEFSALPTGNESFDFADCEDFLARLDAEDSISSYQSSQLSHSLSPDDILSSGHGSSPLSTFSPNNNEESVESASSSWGVDSFLFPVDQQGSATSAPVGVPSNEQPSSVFPSQIRVNPDIVKSEYESSAQPEQVLNNSFNSYPPADFNVHHGSISSASSLSPSSLSPASSASSHMMSPPYKGYGLSPSQYAPDQLPPANLTIKQSYSSPEQQPFMVPRPSVVDVKPVVQVNVTPESIKQSAATTKRAPSTSHGAVRRTSASTRGSQSSGGQSPPESAKTGKVTKPKKTAHNMIEKRYRTNLNDKIAALRDCVPALRCAVTGNFDEEEDELDGLAPANKLNKATVLTKATEYIMHLQQRNAQLMRENKALMDCKFPDRVESNMMAEDSQTGMDASMMHGVMRAPQAPVNNGISTDSHMYNLGRNTLGKAMMGGMAVMMVGNSFGDEGHNSRGLAAVPFMIRSYAQSALGPYSPVVMGALRGVLLLGTLMYIFYPSLFDNQPSKGSKKQTLASMSFQRMSVSSPLEVRQQAWLSAFRTVYLPPRVLPLEMYMVFKKLGKLSLRRLVGVDGYRLLMNTTEEEDMLRTSAWKMAIDAQLGGGDPECSSFRLFITLLASFLIPATPVSAMLQALHVKILLHDYKFLSGLSDRVERSLWNQARKLQQAQNEAGVPADSSEKTPEYLVNLLECDDVFDEDTVTRAYNLTWNKSPNKGLICSYRDEGIRSVTDDIALKSPLDALAAWYSSRKLRGALIEAIDGIPDATVLATSVKVAPSNSVVNRRALIARSILLGDICPEFTKEMMEAIREDLKATAAKNVEPKSHIAEVPASEHSEESFEEEDEDQIEEADVKADIDAISVSLSSELTDDSVDLPSSSIAVGAVRMLASADLRAAIRCALVQTLLPSRPYVAEKLYASLKAYSTCEMGLLGFVAVLTTVRKMQRRSAVDKTSEALVGRARIWIGGDEGIAAGIATDTRRAIVNECVKTGMRLGGYGDVIEEEDEGYATSE